MPNTQLLQQTANKFGVDLQGYQKAQKQFNFDADVYNKQLNEYQGIVNAYNSNPAVVAYKQAVDNYNNSLLPDYQAKANDYNNNQLPAYQSQVNDYNKRVNSWQNDKITVTLPLIGDRTLSPENAYKAFISRAQNTQSEADRDYQQGRANELLARYGLDKPQPTAPTAPSAPSTPTEPNVQRPGDFTAVKPVFTAEAPKDPGFTKTQIDALSGKQTLAQMERNADTGLIAGMRANTQTERSGGSAIAGLLSKARYST